MYSTVTTADNIVSYLKAAEKVNLKRSHHKKKFFIII